MEDERKVYLQKRTFAFLLEIHDSEIPKGWKKFLIQSTSTVIFMLSFIYELNEVEELLCTLEEIFMLKRRIE